MNSLWSFTRRTRPTLVSQFVTCQSSEKRVKETSRSSLPAALLVLVLFTAGLALAQSDPFVGTWELNVAKSKFGPGAARKSETRIIASSSAGVRVSVDRTNADGSNQQYNYTTNFDGKPYPITGEGPFGADSVAVTLGTSMTSDSDTLSEPTTSCCHCLRSAF